MNWVSFEGNYYEVGYQLGYWWGTHVKRLRYTAPGKAFLAAPDGAYGQLLSQSWYEGYWPLFENMARRFPEICEELAGMSRGATDAGFPTTALDLLTLNLEEPLRVTPACSAIAIRRRGKVVLGHNEENERKYPLCFAKVTLRVNRRVKKFVSVSYPFEFFGGAVGMTPSFAFQNNSIGCSDQALALQKTWTQRIPKSIVMRKMLECSTKSEVESLLRSHHLTLPYHQYLCFAGAVYSIEVRPMLKPTRVPSGQYVIHRLSDFVHRHTNHFVVGGKFDESWDWGSAWYLRQSRRRYALLGTVRRSDEAGTIQAVKDALMYLSQRTATARYSCATTLFQIDRQGSSCQAWHHFGDRSQYVGQATLRRR